MSVLRVARESGESHVVALRHDRLLIGREKECDVVLARHAVSRRHAEITRREDRYYLKDLSSRNGTFLCGDRVEGEVAFRPGDPIQIGDATLTIELEPLPTEKAAPASTEEGAGMAQTQSEMIPLEFEGPSLVQSETEASDFDSLGTQSEATSRESDNRRIDRFDLIEKVGMGSFGTVYRARDSNLDREVALKVPRADTLFTQRDAQRFVREARAAARLRHPSIVPVYEAQLLEDSCYIVAGFVEGVPLDQLMDEGRRFSHEAAAVMVSRLASALHYAHNRGVIHRDVKPSNVMLDAEDSPHLMDFGLARRVESEGAAGRHYRVGTAGYMSPEQAQGESHSADARSDLWSLGVVLYQLLLHGRRPFDGSRMQRIQAALSEHPKRPREVDPSVPKDLDAICMKCLEKDPDDRYPSCQHLADEIQRWLRCEPIVARSITPIERALYWVRRSPGRAGLAAATVLLLLFVTAGSVVAYSTIRASKSQTESALRSSQRQAVIAEEQRQRANDSARKARASAEQAAKERERANRQAELATQSAELATKREKEAVHLREIAEAERHRAEDREQVANRYLYAAQVNLATRLWGLGDRQAVIELLERHQPQEAARDLRGFEWHYLWRLCHRDQITLKGHEGRAVRSLVFLPGTDRLVSVGDDRKLRIWDLQSRRAEEFDAPAIETLVAAKNGRLFASRSGAGGIILWSPQGNPRRSFSEGYDSFSIMPNGNNVSMARPEGIAQVEVASDKAPKVQPWPWPATPESTVILAEDGTIAARITSGKAVELWHLGAGTKYADLRGVTQIVERVVLSPDARRLATHLGAEGGIKLWDASTGALIATLKTAPRDRPPMAFSPVSEVFATGDNDGGVSLWDSATGERLDRLQGESVPVESLAFSNDGMRLATGSADGTIKIWTLGPGQETGPLLGHRRAITDADFTSDGRILATTDLDGVVKLWNVPSGELLDTLSVDRVRLLSVAISPDRRTLLAGGGDGRLYVWDLATAQAMDAIKAHRSRVNGVVFSPDGKRWVTAGNSGIVKVWDAETRTVQNQIDAQSAVLAAVFSPDGQRVALGTEQKTVAVWDMKSSEALVPLGDHYGAVESVAFSADGRSLASGSKDGIARLFDVESSSLLATFGHLEAVSSVSFCPSGNELCTASLDGRLRFWDLETEQVRAEIQAHPNRISQVRFSPQGNVLGTVGDDRTVRLWHTGEPAVEASSESRQPASVPRRAALHRHAGPVYSLAYSPDGTILATGGRDQTARIWDGRTADVRRILRGHVGYVEYLGFLPKTQGLITVSHDPGFGRPGSRDPSRQRTTADNRRPWEVRLYAFSNGQGRSLFQMQASSTARLALSPDTGVLAVARGDDRPGTIEVRDVSTGAVLHLLSSENRVTSLAFSPDGGTLAAAGLVSGELTGTARARVTLWEVAGGKQKSTFLAQHDGANQPVAGDVFRLTGYSPDGKMLATTGGGKVKLWNAATGKELATVDGDHPVAFSRDGRRLAVRQWRQNAVVLLAAANRDVIRTFALNDGHPTSLAFSPDGTALAIADSEGFVQVLSSDRP